MNNLKTGLLLTLLTCLLVFAGYSFGGQSGALLAFGLALAMNAFAYWGSDRVVLRLYKAREIQEADDPELYAVVADLAQRAAIPMPRICVIPGPALNAFATGRNPGHAVVAVTEGLRQHLDRRELQGVLAHELSHVKHRDILIGSVAATIAGTVAILGSMARWGAIFGGFSRDDDGPGGNLLVMLVVTMIAGLAASMVQLAISRSREFEADAGAARLLGDPGGLISALRKLELGSERIPMQASPATAHMFIVNPLRGRRLATRMFRTHPPIEDRIARLQAGIGIR
ncbi:MAG: zinc metalloprotease HtpX [Myxococcota bacterium]|nr:zinc metalloprotease HtpX [Myxococcota bacterium]